MSEPWAASEAADHTASCIHELLGAERARQRPKTVQWSRHGADGCKFEIIDARTGNCDRTILVAADGTVSRQVPNDELKSDGTFGFGDLPSIDKLDPDWGKYIDHLEKLVATYPHEDGDTIVLGPETFAILDRSVICWKGVNYVRQDDGTEVATDASPKFSKKLALAVGCEDCDAEPGEACYAVDGHDETDIHDARVRTFEDRISFRGDLYNDDGTTVTPT